MAEAGASPALHPPLQGQTLLLAALALSLATFMNVLDTTIANVSIPAISGDLGVSPAQGTWVITSFAVSNAIGVPLTGWLSTRFGAVRMFVTSVLMFVAASLLCALSRSLEMLLLFRVIQGLVAAPMIPLSLALLLQCFPREKSGMAMAAWAMTTLVAPVVGPILGGWLTDNLAWPWIFYINVPVGLLAAWGPGCPCTGAKRRRTGFPSTMWGWACWCSGLARCRSCSTRAANWTGSIPG